MADPITMLMVGSSVLGGFSSLASGNQAAAEANQAAAVADQNALIAEQNGRLASQKASRDELLFRRGSKEESAKQFAAIAAGGTGLGGTNALIMNQSSVNAELDALTLRYDGKLVNNTYKNEAQNQRYQAEASRQAAKSAKSGGMLGFGTSLLMAGAYGAGYGLPTKG